LNKIKLKNNFLQKNYFKLGIKVNQIKIFKMGKLEKVVNRGILKDVKILMQRRFEFAIPLRTRQEILMDCSEAFYIAVMRGYLDIVRYFVDEGYHLSKYDDEFLVLSAKYKHWNITKFFLSKGHDPCRSSKILKYAMDSENFEIIKYLFNNGYDSIKNYNKILKLKNNLDIIKYLVEQDCCSAINFYKVLKLSIEKGLIENVKYFMSLGMDPRFMNDTGLTTACHCGHLELVKYFISLGCMQSDGKKRFGCYGDWNNFWLVDITEDDSIIKYILQSLTRKDFYEFVIDSWGIWNEDMCWSIKFPRVSTTTYIKKHNFLKQILRPTSQAIQLTFV
jgi:ankyrin repeat protein